MGDRSGGWIEDEEAMEKIDQSMRLLIAALLGFGQSTLEIVRPAETVPLVERVFGFVASFHHDFTTSLPWFGGP